jgi:L-alanine-DL-glutamate epimerase-like enolase superfamily enzyme
LRIVRIDVFDHELTPLAGDFRLSRGRTVRAQRSLLVRIRTDTDVEGWGESCPLTSVYLPSFSGGVQAALAELAPALVGADPRNIADVRARMEATLLGQEAAKSALDIACWDILGQVTRVPLVTLLGGRATARLPLSAAIPMADAEETEAHVRRARAAGFRRLQVKVGGDPLTDAATVRRVLELAGPGALVVADANGGWSLAEALVAVRLLAGLPIHLEQPCRRFAECIHVRGATTLPLILDESVTDTDTLVRAVREGGATGVNLKLGKLGGLTPARMLRDVAAALGASVTIEDTWGGDVATAAVSHLAASTPPEALFAVSFLNDAVAEHVAGHVPCAHDGEGDAPNSPGLGIAVDDALLGAPLLSAPQ